VAAVMIHKLPSVVSDVTIDGSERDLMFGLLPKHDRKVKRGTSFTPQDLLFTSLISSNNLTTSALAIQIGLDDVLQETEQLVKLLGLTSVQITEPTGLSRANVGSARDLANFGLHLLYTEVAAISVTPQHEVNGTTFNTTNVFTRLSGWNVHVQKTGFTNAAGRCVLMVLEMRGKVYSLVLLGAPSQQAIWRDVVAIRKFVGDSGFEEPRVVAPARKRVNKRPVVTPNSLMKG
jgi:serine-type D-Ala-D-Ala endopeptidase (penicillin-binding protein 7)